MDGFSAMPVPPPLPSSPPPPPPPSFTVVQNGNAKDDGRSLLLDDIRSGVQLKKTTRNKVVHSSVSFAVL